MRDIYITVSEACHDEQTFGPYPAFNAAYQAGEEICEGSKDMQYSVHYGDKAPESSMKTYNTAKVVYDEDYQEWWLVPCNWKLEQVSPLWVFREREDAMEMAKEHLASNRCSAIRVDGVNLCFNWLEEL